MDGMYIPTSFFKATFRFPPEAQGLRVGDELAGGWGVSGEKELDLIFLVVVVVEAKNKRAHMWTLGSLFGQSSSCHMDAKYSCLCAESIRLRPCSSPALG